MSDVSEQAPAPTPRARCLVKFAPGDVEAFDCRGLEFVSDLRPVGLPGGDPRIAGGKTKGAIAWDAHDPYDPWWHASGHPDIKIKIGRSRHTIVFGAATCAYGLFEELWEIYWASKHKGRCPGGPASIVFEGGTVAVEWLRWDWCLYRFLEQKAGPHGPDELVEITNFICTAEGVVDSRARKE